MSAPPKGGGSTIAGIQDIRRLLGGAEQRFDMPSGASSVGSAETLYPRLSHPGSIEPAIEREAGRNVEVMLQTNRLAADREYRQTES
jgi:hypothetical protein